MPTVYLDHIKTLSATERRGRLEAVQRSARVIGLTNGDWSILTEALDQLGLKAGSQLSANYPNLKLVARRPKLVSGSNDAMDVTLDYEYEHTRVQWSGGVSLQTVTTSKNAPANDPNGRTPSEVTVEYNYPDDYQANPLWQGLTDKQTGEIQVDVQASTQVAKFVVQRHLPGELLKDWVAFVNDKQWAGGRPRTWKVTDGRIREFDTSVRPFKYEIELEFSHNPNGWDEEVVYRDPNTGELPPDVFSQASAHKVVKWLPSRNFEDLPT